MSDEIAKVPGAELKFPVDEIKAPVIQIVDTPEGLQSAIQRITFELADLQLQMGALLAGPAMLSERQAPILQARIEIEEANLRMLLARQGALSAKAMQKAAIWSSIAAVISAATALVALLLQLLK